MPPGPTRSSSWPEAIDDAFGRWDLNHLHEFVLADGTCLGLPDPQWDEGRVIVHARRVKLSRLGLGERFAYVFDPGEYWTHLCTVGPTRLDPIDFLGLLPPRPTAVFGWGDVPDQHGRRWAGDNGEGPMPADTAGRDLPALLPSWGQAGGAVPDNVRPLRRGPS